MEWNGRERRWTMEPDNGMEWNGQREYLMLAWKTALPMHHHLRRLRGGQSVLRRLSCRPTACEPNVAMLPIRSCFAALGAVGAWSCRRSGHRFAMASRIIGFSIDKPGIPCWIAGGRRCCMAARGSPVKNTDLPWLSIRQPKIDNRVVQQEWSNGGRSNLYGFARINVSYSILALISASPDGKVAILQLDRHDPVQFLCPTPVKGSRTVANCLPGMKFGIKMVSLLNVIPVRVGKPVHGLLVEVGTAATGRAERYRFQRPESNNSLASVRISMQVVVAAIANRGGPR